MRLAEILNSVPVYLTKDEADFTDRLQSGKVFKRDLSEQEAEIASQLVNKNVLKRRNEDGRIYFVRRKTQ